MTKFQETTAAAAFIATGASRETSPEIMTAIAFFARNLDEAEKIWDGDYAGLCYLSDIVEHVTNNGLRDASNYYWGASGNAWATDRD